MTLQERKDKADIIAKLIDSLLLFILAWVIGTIANKKHWKIGNIF